ncbi:hypothetical protein ACLOJK_011787 [Asimina triloba]
MPARLQCDSSRSNGACIALTWLILQMGTDRVTVHVSASKVPSTNTTAVCALLSCAKGGPSKRVAMGSRLTWAVLLAVVVFAVVLHHHRGVEAARVLAEEFDGSEYLTTYPASMYEKAKSSMELWMSRLVSGPSPGAGH